MSEQISDQISDRISDWISELRVETLHHDPGQTQALSDKYCVDCEVDYQHEPGRS